MATARHCCRAAGFSLVELLVGLTIGLALTLGLFTLIANSSISFKVQDDFSRMQESATAGLRYIGDSVRMAGFYGYVMDPANLIISSVNTTTDCGATAGWALQVGMPIFGAYGLTPLNVTPAFRAFSP